MPISTVASESAFSTGCRVIDMYRSSLNTDTMEALICAQGWIRSSPMDLELGSAMNSKDMDDLNEKMAGLKTPIPKGKRYLLKLLKDGRELSFEDKLLVWYFV